MRACLRKSFDPLRHHGVGAHGSGGPIDNELAALKPRTKLNARQLSGAPSVGSPEPSKDATPPTADASTSRLELCFQAARLTALDRQKRSHHGCARPHAVVAA